MKYHYKQLLFIFSIGLIASCSQSEDPDLTDLPAGRYPLELCASIDDHRSRAGMDAWTGGENIAVSLAGGDAVKYIISGSDGDAKAAEGAKPIYWEKTEEATITSWWPYSTSKQTVDVKDQSKGIEPFDFLRAEATGDYRGPVSLTFRHQMARISYTLIAGDGITAEELDEAVVKLRGNAGAVVDKGTVEAATDGVTSEITPFSDPRTHSGDVLLPPQDLSDSPMIDVTVGASRFSYIPAEGQAELKAGLRYNYRITVNARGISVDAVTGAQWTDGGSENINSRIIVTAYTADQLKIGDYVYADGTTSDGGLRSLFDDGTLRSTDVQPIEEKQCVGIIFHIRHSGSPEDESGYSEFNAQLPTGYVVSLDQNTSAWCDAYVGKNYETPEDKLNGYKYTSIYYYTYNATRDLIAIKWCKNHEAINNSENLAYTLWYMPSPCEYKLMRADGAMQVLNLIDANIKKASGVGFINDYEYFACGGLVDYQCASYDFKTDKDWTFDISGPLPYRAVCAFRAK